MVLLALLSARAQQESMQKAAPNGAGAGPGDPVLYRHYKGLKAMGVEDAWKMGVTGKGVNVAVIDDGIDFGNADLYGSQARVATQRSPYYGWPIVIDTWSITKWQERGNTDDGMSEYADTASTDTTGYIVTGTSKSGIYHIGCHPDRTLKDSRGERVKVLLVDEKEAGVYDTVYVDLNGNRDFRDDKACRKGDEISVWDRDDDGLPDETGGMIYFIADGVNPPPLGTLLYGSAAKVPKRAELVAFFYPRTSHGTMCAGTIGARGKVVRGIAPDVHFIPVLSAGDDKKEVLLASLGYDGLPNTGDEANIISRSGAYGFVQKGGDELSAFLEYLTTQVVPNTTFVYGANNEGSGHGSSGAPASDHVITAGAIEDLWFKGSPNRGDVASFSGRGPNALGQIRPNVLGVGAFAPRVRPLMYTHSGASSYDKNGGGTSNGTPHVAGVIALIYQAYKETHGVFPTSEMARDILMSSADDINEEPFAQGAGSINARKAVEIARGRSGLLIQPALYSSSVPLAAGSKVDFRVALSNHTGQKVSAVPQHLVRVGRATYKIAASHVGRLFPVPKDAIHGDILQISSFVPVGGPQVHTLQDTYKTGYWLSAYNWRDLNHDGKFDSDGSGTLDTAQKGEVELLANTDWGPGSTDEVRIHDPQQRIADGLLLGFKHAGDDLGGELSNDPDSVQDVDVTVVVESFAWQPWDALRVTGDKAGLQCSLQAPGSSGVFEGRILLSSEGGKVRHSVPVSFATYLTNEIRTASTQDIYENDRLYARLEGTGRFGFRDGRFFPVMISGTKRAAIKVAWQDLGTDIDLALYGKGSVESAKVWNFPAPPPVKLPVLPILTATARTARRIETVHPLTPATEKTLIANVEDGLYYLIVMPANSGRSSYGEQISLQVTPLAGAPAVASMPKMVAKAGQTLEQPTSADAVLGFGRRIEVQALQEPYRFEARRGDHAILNLPRTGVEVIFDSDNNGKLDESTDEVILRDELNEELVATAGQVFSLPYDGTYFISHFTGSFVLLPHRYPAEDGKVLLTVPQKAGDYVGIAEKDGQLLSGELSLTVQPSEAVRVEIKPAADVVRGHAADIGLQVLDVFGNPVAKDLDATVSLRGVAQKVQIVNGKGNVQLQIPDMDGDIPVSVRTELGVDQSTLKPGTVSTAKGENKPAPVVANEPSGEKLHAPVSYSAAARPAKPVWLHAVPEKNGLRFTWKAPASSEIDHYVVYRMGRDWKKADETREPQYFLKGELWNSYTIRVTAVDKNGVESEPSDPCGVVLTPLGS
jgi:subtilisin family serine protease